MGLNFRKSIKIAPGLRLNVGKKSVGLSAGVRGARVSVNSSGRKTGTIGIPGTGISYRTNLKTGASQSNTDNEFKSDELADDPKGFSVDVTTQLKIANIIANMAVWSFLVTALIFLVGAFSSVDASLNITMAVFFAGSAYVMHKFKKFAYKKYL